MRVPLLEANNLSPKQRPIYDDMRAGIEEQQSSRRSGRRESDRGAAPPIWASLQLRQSLPFVHSLTRHRGGFGPKARVVSRCGRVVSEMPRWRASSLAPCSR